MKIKSLFLFFVILIISLTGCKSAEPVYEDVPVPEGDIFSMRISEDPETLDNVLTTSGAAATVMGLTFAERLIYIGTDNLVHGWLAESWTLNDNQNEVTFILRQGIKFTDGTDFNADAVKVSF